jgi:hypothetical protein
MKEDMKREDEIGGERENEKANRKGRKSHKRENLIQYGCINFGIATKADGNYDDDGSGCE